MLFDEDLDATGQRCPIPVLKTRKRMKSMAPGAVLRVSCDDPLAEIDVPNFCREDGHELVGRVAHEDCYRYFIRKGAAGKG